MSNWGIRNDKVLDYKSEIYVAKKLDSTYDDYGNEITNYDEPVKYFFNVQPVTNTSNASAFGELVPRLKVAVIPKTEYENVFNEFDLAYLDGITPEEEVFNGAKANYRIYSVQPQNAIIKVYFLKIISGGIEV